MKTIRNKLLENSILELMTFLLKRLLTKF